MQPLRLEIQAFGPYVHKQVIDFTVLQPYHIFLVQGETGSGKTMLIDAITFALYGKSSGGQRENLESMRSYFAQDQLPTQISFTFMLHKKTYRFYRSVEVRYKRNKEKAYKVSVDAGELIDDVYYPFFENPKQKVVEEKAEELIKLTYEQFVQVMILPQGKFERFLTSKSEEKQEILKSLFQMERWEHICTWMKEEVKKEKQTLETYRQQKQAYLQMMQVTSVEEFYQTLHTLQDGLKKLHIDVQQATICMHTQEKELIRQQKLHDWKQQLTTAKHKEQELHAQTEVIKQYEKEVAFGQRQQQVVPIYQQFQETKRQYVYRQKTYDIANENYQNAQQQIQEIDVLTKLVKEKQEQAYTYQRNYEALTRKKEVIENIIHLQTSLHKYQVSAENKIKAIKKKELEIDELVKKQQQVNREAQALMEVLKSYISVEERWQAYVKAYPHWEAKQRYEQEYKQTMETLASITKVEQREKQQLATLQQEHDILYQQVLDSSILQIAATLEEDKPCPVCGSLHHPSIAQLQQVTVDISSLKDKKQQLDKMKQAYEQMERNITLLKEKAVEYQTQIEKEEQDSIQILSIPFQKQDYEKIKQQYQELQHHNQQYQSLQNKQQELQRLHVEKQQELSTLQQEYTVYQQNIHACKLSLQKEEITEELISIEGLEKEMLYVYKQIQVIQHEITSYQTQIETIQTKLQTTKQALHIAQDELDLAKANYDQCQIQLENAFVTYDMKECDMHNILTFEQIQEKQQKMQVYYETLAIVKSMIQEASQHIEGEELKDISSLQKTYETQKQYVKELEQQEISLTQQLTQKLQMKQQIHHIQEEIIKKEPIVLKKEHFVKAIRGDQGIGIERYILGIFLSMITVNANEILRKIHQGRYQIFRSDEAVGKTRKVGLEFSVYDHYTMSKRSVVSLSGGEKFLVSLALSFAMLHVMQHQNGGVVLDMMFIDEGFGSLDEQSIEDALSILQSMTNHRGIVGIISHVELLKENIVHGIAVRKSKQGSHIQIR